MTSTKTNPGNFFEDFSLRADDRARDAAHGHGRRRGALYRASTAPRFAVQSSDAFAKAIGYPQSPLDDLLTFHVVFGKTAPDISLNAIANLGYAELPLPEAGLSGRHADRRRPR